MEPVLQPLDLGQRLVPYEEAWELQQRLHAQVVAGEAPPTILLLEHAHVYTAGSRTEPGDLPPPDEPLVVVNRGGRITWHGPGQVVAYPIVPLRNPVDVVGFVRALEGAVIEACADLGLTTTRCDGRSGVWVTSASAAAAPGCEPVGSTALQGVSLLASAPATAGGAPPQAVGTAGAGERKVSAVGVRVSRGVSMHGVALNVDCDLRAFGRIVPCGISDAGVTSLAAEGVPLPDTGAVPFVGEVLGRRLSGALRWD